jgi:hypothetical protein
VSGSRDVAIEGSRDAAVVEPRQVEAPEQGKSRCGGTRSGTNSSAKKCPPGLLPFVDW